MAKFKSGDKVRVKSAKRPTFWYAEMIGKVFTLTDRPKFLNSWEVKENYNCWIEEEDMELVEEIKLFDMKTTPWFIRVNNQSEFSTAKEWLESQGFKYKCGRVGWFEGIIGFATNIYYPKESHFYYITENCTFVASRQEIKLTFKHVIDSVEYPTVETEQDKKIRELEQAINEAQQKIQELKEMKT